MNPKQKNKPAGLFNPAKKKSRQSKPQMEIVIFPQEAKHVQELADEVRVSREENWRYLSNMEGALEDRDHRLFKQVLEVVEHKQDQSLEEMRKLREIIEELLEVLDDHLVHWFRTLLEKMQQNSEEGSTLLRAFVKEQLASHQQRLLDKMQQNSEEGSALLRALLKEQLGAQQHRLLDKLEQNSEENQARLRSTLKEQLDARDHRLLVSIRDLTDNREQLETVNHNLQEKMKDLLEGREERLMEWMQQFKEELLQHTTLLIEGEEDEEQGEGEEEWTDEEDDCTFYKLGDRIQVLVDDRPLGGLGAFISMNDEVLVWFDATGQVRFQSLTDDHEVEIRRV